jgi:hypothetical protein
MVTLANFATEYSTLSRTPTWSLWADDQLAQYATDRDNKQKAMNDAYDALVEIDTNIIATYSDCTASQLDPPAGAQNEQFPTDYPMTSPGACADNTAGEAAQNDWKAAAVTYNAALSAYNTALAAYNNALLNLANTRVANLISAQVDPYFNYPNLDSGDLEAVNNWDGEYLKNTTYCQGGPLFDPRGCDFYGVSFLGDFIRGVDAVTALLMTSDVVNEWAVNTVTGADTDFVVTFPTKRFYTDWQHIYEGIGNYPVLFLEFLNSIYDAIAGKVNNGALPPFAEPWSPVAFQSCDQVGYSVYNRDEGVPPDTTVETSPQYRTQLCNEANVLYFGPNGSLLNSNTEDLGVAQLVSKAAPLGSNGWLDLDLTTSFHAADFSNSQWHPVLGDFYYPFGIDQVGGPFDYMTGMPAVGFSFKERNFGQSASYGGITEHSYIREFEGNEFNIFDLFPALFPPGDLPFVPDNG